MASYSYGLKNCKFSSLVVEMKWIMNSHKRQVLPVTINDYLYFTKQRIYTSNSINTKYIIYRVIFKSFSE